MKTIKLLFLFLLGTQSMQAQESEAFYHEGTITNQDGNPIAGATVCIYSIDSNSGVNNHEYYGTSDEEGHYVVKVEEGIDNQYVTFKMSVKCSGFPSYDVNYPFRLGNKYMSFSPVPKDITLWNKLTFTKDQKATIILPEAPDPSWGRYYRLSHFRTEDRMVVFEREYNPQANVPYVIFPNDNFCIDLIKYDLDNLSEPGIIPLFPDDPDESEFKSGFKGSYKNTDLLFHQFYLLDDTPDCCHGETVDGEGRRPRVGAFHAYLDGSRHFHEEYGTPNFLFVGEQTSVSSIKAISDASVLFDLQGRRLNAEPKHGVYIRNGKKVVK